MCGSIFIFLSKSISASRRNVMLLLGTIIIFSCEFLNSNITLRRIDDLIDVSIPANPTPFFATTGKIMLESPKRKKVYRCKRHNLTPRWEIEICLSTLGFLLGSVSLETLLAYNNKSTVK